MATNETLLVAILFEIQYGFDSRFAKWNTTTQKESYSAGSGEAVENALEGGGEEPNQQRPTANVLSVSGQAGDNLSKRQGCLVR